MRTIRLATLAAAVLALGLAGCDNSAETDDTLTDASVDAPMPGTVDDTIGANTAPGTATASGTDTATAGPGLADDAGTMADAGSTAVSSLAVATVGAASPYLSDGSGRAVYFLEGDRDGAGCTGACLEAWPPVLAGAATPDIEGDLQAGLLGRLERADGTTQLTYNDHPLYYYAQDTGAGTATGHDVTDDWGEWYLLSPEGTELGEAELEEDG